LSSKKQPRALLNKRRAARFAAVQALYQAELGEQPIDRVIEEFGAHRLAELLEPLGLGRPSPPVDSTWFEIVTRGAWQASARLDPLIEPCLGEGWSLARCGYLARACLRAGAFELADRGDVPPTTAINEYVELANLFLPAGDARFVNAVLDRLARRLRENRVVS